MEVIGCNCNLDIPGVESLPAHQHVGAKVLVQGTNGRQAWIFEHDLALNIADVTVLERQEESIHVWVPWREVARYLSAHTTDEDEYELRDPDGKIVALIVDRHA